MIKRLTALKVVLTGTAIFALVSCDKDFNEIGSDIVGDDHFGLELNDEVTVIANNNSTGAVQSNNLDINPLGIYNNPVFGKTTAEFVTQLELNSQNPTFKTINQAPAIDSVVLYIPYFSHATSSTSNGGRTYELDSVFGGEDNKMSLKVFRSGFFLRDTDHNPDTGALEQQRYYTDQQANFATPASPLLNDAGDPAENLEFTFSNKEIVEKRIEDDGDEVRTRLAPGMRLHLNSQYFQDNIINAPAGSLVSNNAFKNYFRGLVFNVEQGSDPGQMAMMNFKNGKITIYYKEDYESAVDDEQSVTRIDKRLVMSLAGNSVSLLKNENESANYLSAVNQPWNPAGVERLYLRGGQGSVATINLFGPDSDGDGVPDELEELRTKFKPDASGVDQDGVWLLNEANLTFYIDRAGDAMGATGVIEPERIYLYDVNNKRPLVDYLFDNSTNSNPKKAKAGHDGMINRREVVNGQAVQTSHGVKYRVRITNYIRDLLTKDSTNVTLGLSVTESIGITSMRKLRNANENLNNFVPTAMVTNPLGTILYGNTYADPEKRLKLELYYTKPNLQD